MRPRFVFLPSFLCLAVLTAAAAPGDPPRLDCYGDSLPDGAVFRIGTTRLRTLPNHMLPPFKQLLLSPDGKFVFSSATREGDVCMWEIATGRVVRRFPTLLSTDILTFALSPDGSLLAACDGEQIHLYKTATGKRQRTIDLSPEKISYQSLALTFSSDGKRLLLRHWYWYEGPAKLNGILGWDIATGKNIGHWKMGAEAPLALSADNRLVASMRPSGYRIVLWETATGKKFREWETSGKTPLQDRCLIFSPDGRSLAIADVEDNWIRVYETATGKKVQSLDGGKSYDAPTQGSLLQNFVVAGGLAFAPDGKTLASVDDSRKALTLWDWRADRALHQFKDVAGPVAFSPDGKILAAGGKDYRIRLWETATGCDLCPFADPGGIFRVAFSPDGRVLAAGADHALLHLLDAGSGLPPKQYPNYHLAGFSPDGGSLLAWRRNQSLCLLNATTGEERSQFRGTEEDAFLEGWNADKKLLLTKDDSAVRVWDPTTGKKLRELRGKNKWFHASCSADARMVAIADRKDTIIRLFATETGQELRQLTGYSEDVHYDAKRGNKIVGGSGGVYPVFSPNGKVVLAGCDRNSFGLWDVASGKQTLRWNCAEVLPAHPTFSPDGKWLALPDTHGDPCLVDAATGRVSHRLAWKGGDLDFLILCGHGININRAFSSDSRLFAAAYDAHTIVLWETATGRSIHTWPGHGKGEVRQMVFSSDGRRLATVGTDGTALVWDVTGMSPDGQLPARKLTPVETKQAWLDLADADAAKGHRAIWTLVADPAQALPVLREQLHPARGGDPRRVAQSIADLDSDDFAVREAATRELKKLGEVAQPALQAALKGKPSLELRRRVQGLLDEMDSATPSAERLRALRAVAVLEYIASAEARQLLSVLADGAPEARLTREAKAALARLRSRHAQS